MLTTGYVGFVAGVDPGFLPSDKSTVRLGGDGHLARLRVEVASSEGSASRTQAIDNLWEQTSTNLKHYKRFLVYLMTPGIFANGWGPPAKIPGRLVGAAVGSPTIVAGWDLATKQPKPLRRAVPSGSVFFYETTPETDLDALIPSLQPFHFGNSVSDEGGELGFGMALIGLWQEERT